MTYATYKLFREISEVYYFETKLYSEMSIPSEIPMEQLPLVLSCFALSRFAPEWFRPPLRESFRPPTLSRFAHYLMSRFAHFLN